MNIARCIESFRDSLPASQLCTPQNSTAAPFAAVCMLHIHPENKHAPNISQGFGVSRSGKERKECSMLGSEKRKIGIAMYKLLEKIGVPCKANIEPSVFMRTKTLNQALCELCYVTYPVDMLKSEKASVDGNNDNRTHMELAIRQNASRDAMFTRVKRENERLMRELENEKNSRLKVEQNLAENALALGMAKTDLQSLQEVHHADEKRWKKRLDREIKRADVSLADFQASQRKSLLDLQKRYAVPDSRPSFAVPLSSRPSPHAKTALEAMSSASSISAAEPSETRWVPLRRAPAMQFASTLPPASPAAVLPRQDPSLLEDPKTYLRTPQGDVTSLSFKDITNAKVHKRQTSLSAPPSKSTAARQAVSQRCRKTLARSASPLYSPAVSSYAVPRGWDGNEALCGAGESRKSELYPKATRTSSAAYRPRSAEQGVKGTSHNAGGNVSQYRRDNRDREALHAASFREDTRARNCRDKVCSRTHAWEGGNVHDERRVQRNEVESGERSNDKCCGKRKGADAQSLRDGDNWSYREELLNSAERGVPEILMLEGEFSSTEVQYSPRNGKTATHRENGHASGVWSAASAASSCDNNVRENSRQLARNRTKLRRGQPVPSTFNEEECNHHRLPRPKDDQGGNGEKKSYWMPSEDVKCDFSEKKELYLSNSKLGGERKGFAERSDVSLSHEDRKCFFWHQNTERGILGSNAPSDKEEREDAGRKRHWALNYPGQKEHHEHESLSDSVRHAGSDSNVSCSSVHHTFKTKRTSEAFRQDHSAAANDENHAEKVWRAKNGYGAETSSSDDEGYCPPPNHPTRRGSKDANMRHESCNNNEQKNASSNNGNDIRSILKRERRRRSAAYEVKKKEIRQTNMTRGNPQLVAQQIRATKEKGGVENKLTNDTFSPCRRNIPDKKKRESEMRTTKCRKEQPRGFHYAKTIVDSLSKDHGNTNTESPLQEEQVTARDRRPLKDYGGRFTSRKAYSVGGDPERTHCLPPGVSCSRHVSSGSEDAAEIRIDNVRGINDLALAEEAERLLLVESLLKRGMVDKATALLAETSDLNGVPSPETSSRASEVGEVISLRGVVKNISDAKRANKTGTRQRNVGDGVPPKTRHVLAPKDKMSINIEDDEISSSTRDVEARVRENRKKRDAVEEVRPVSGASCRVDGATRESFSAKEKRGDSFASRQVRRNTDLMLWEQPEWRDKATDGRPADHLQPRRREKHLGTLTQCTNPQQREETGRRSGLERHRGPKSEGQSVLSVECSGAEKQGEQAYSFSEVSEDARREGCARSPTKSPQSEREEERMHPPVKRYENDRAGGRTRLPAQGREATWNEKSTVHLVDCAPSTHTINVAVTQRPAENPLLADEAQPSYEPFRHPHLVHGKAGHVTLENGSPPFRPAQERIYTEGDLVDYDSSDGDKGALDTSQTGAFAAKTLPPRQTFLTPQSLSTIESTPQFAKHDTKPGLRRTTLGSSQCGSFNDNISRDTRAARSTFRATHTCDDVPHEAACAAETPFPVKCVNSIFEDGTSALEWARIASPTTSLPLAVQAVVTPDSPNPEECFRKMELRAERQRQQRQQLLDAVKNCNKRTKAGGRG